MSCDLCQNYGWKIEENCFSLSSCLLLRALKYYVFIVVSFQVQVVQLRVTTYIVHIITLKTFWQCFFIHLLHFTSLKNNYIKYGCTSQQLRDIISLSNSFDWGWDPGTLSLFPHLFTQRKNPAKQFTKAHSQDPKAITCFLFRVEISKN